ncbi:MAG: response regulator transcription factor [Verrucomicrobia bacterium]|nr:response regulator transcription factor [Verrucomicrobiota bacterium]MBI3869286.1 response regulator transcription factor [Verrucomicrobiota bacterium]
MRLRVIIADDEALARQRLRRLLRDEPDFEIVAECATGAETLQAIHDHLPDLVLMDVRMPELDAFEVIKGMGPHRTPAVILVTAHDMFAVRAFEAGTVDYLLKPFDRARLTEAVSRARARVKRVREAVSLPAAPQPLDSRERPLPLVDRLAVKSYGRITLIKLTDIGWIESANNYCELHLGNAVRLFRRNMTALEELLPGSLFVRISRSLMVNIEHIKELRAKSHGDYTVVLRDGKELTASRNYREGFLRRVGRLVD